MSGFSNLDLAGIRAARTAMQAQEDAVSFVRRMAQGRLDIARDEQRRRAENLPTSNTATDLAGVFGQEHGGGSARPCQRSSMFHNDCPCRTTSRLAITPLVDTPRQGSGKGTMSLWLNCDCSHPLARRLVVREMSCPATRFPRSFLRQWLGLVPILSVYLAPVESG